MRVLLADDQEEILARVRTVLDKDFEVVGAVRNGREAVTVVCRLHPEVVVMDISVPILNGLEAVFELGSNPRAKIVFLTLYEDHDFIEAAFSAGASAYVVKSDLLNLPSTIREVLAGGTYISPSILPRNREGDL